MSDPTLTIPIDMHGRRWRIGDDCGEVFDEGEDYDGLTLTIELRSEAEADAVRKILGDLT